VAVWALILLVISLVSTWLMTATAGPALMKLAKMPAFQPSSDPTQVFATFSQLLPMYGALLLFSLLFYPVLYAAMNRAVLRPSDERYAYLRLGADELRQLLLLLLYAGMFLAAYVGVILVMVLVFTVIALVASAFGQAVAGVVTALAAAIAVVGIFCAVIFLAVRLSLASALTFATRRVNLFGSWTITRGRFLPMLGAYLLALLMAALVRLLVIALASAVAAIVGGATNPFALFFTVDMSSPAAYFTPPRIAYLVLVAMSSALIWPLVLAPPATIYRNLATSHGLTTGADGSVVDVFT
jgi:hypothetical protein